MKARGGLITHIVHEEEVSGALLLLVLLGTPLVDAGSPVRRVSSEGDAELLQELIHAWVSREEEQSAERS